MAKIFTDENLIDKFLNRGVDYLFPSKTELKKKLMSGDRLRVYQGFDPTGPYLHIGHAMGIRALSILQKLGHEVIFLIGDYTARVGDPDKDKTRELLTGEKIEQNMQGWKKQAGQLIDFEGENPVLFKHNFEWLSKLTMEDLIKLMSQATVQQMLERDLFQKRIKDNIPIGLQEFIYPLMQGYDSVAMQVDMELGGSDQIFNMLVGRQLCKNYLNKEKFIRANTLMEAPDEATMSKTKGNGLNLSDGSNDMYGKAMSYGDHMIVKGLTLLTDIEEKEIEDIQKQIENGENPMKFKKLMAFEIVKIVRGENDAHLAQKHFEETVQNKQITQADLIKINIAGEITVLEIASKLNDISKSDNSTSDLKRIITQSGFEYNNNKITDYTKKIDVKNGDKIKLGKRLFGVIE